jgi:hypothetical protein
MIAGRPIDVPVPEVRTRRWSLALLARPAAVVLVIAALTTPVLLQPWVTSDGIGHYAYLRTVMFDHDLEMANEFDHYSGVFHDYGPATLEQIETSPVHPVNTNPIIDSPTRTPTGLTWNPWPVGSSLLWAPFVLATWPIVEGLRAAGLAIPNDGYSLPYALAVAIGTVVYGVLGLLLCLQLCLRYCTRQASLLAVLATWFATPFVFYFFVMPSYYHVNSMFAVTWFVWYWHRRFQDDDGTETLAAPFCLGLIGGLMTAVQWTNATFLVTFGALGAWSAWTSARRAPATARLMRVARYGVLLSVGWLLTFWPQLVVNHALYGSPLANPQPAGFFDHLTSPQILGVLFSSDRGLLFWTPLVAFALLGLAVCPRPARALAGVLFLNFLMHLYINASVDGCSVPMSTPETCTRAWAGDSAFGQRRFTNQTLLFTLGLAALLQALESTSGTRRRWVRPLRVALPAAAVVWNLLLVVQYVLWIAPHTGEFTVAELVRGQLEALERLGTIVKFVL